MKARRSEAGQTTVEWMVLSVAGLGSGFALGAAAAVALLVLVVAAAAGLPTVARRSVSGPRSTSPSGGDR
jgi:hypothetical protein